IIIKIALGGREKIVDNTPPNYANLIQKCWSTEQDQRPPLNEVLDELNKLSTETTILTSNNIETNAVRRRFRQRSILTEETHGTF
ncbi:19256_t:CDS:2, partial [Dentiscutata erythropus]